MKKLAIALVLLVALPLVAQTKIDLAQHAKPPGTNGQLLYNNAGVVDAEDPIVSGAAAAGSAPVNFPVYVAGHDYGSGCSAGPCVRAFKVDSSGNIYSIVTNAGTFAVQATLAAETTKVIGTVNVAAGQTIGVTGTFWQTTQPVSIASMPSTPVTGTFWQATQPVSNAGTFAVQAAGTKTDNNAAPSTDNVPVLAGIARTDYRGGTAATAGRNLMPDVGTDGLLHVATLPDTSIKRYRASSKFAASSTTDNWRINGNASNTVLVTYLSLTCTQTTAGVLSVEVAKRSTAGSGGTAGTPTVVPMDSNKAAGSSVVNSYTGTGPTVGTLVGDLDNAQVGCMASATATPNDIYIANWRTAPIVLRGTAEGIAINLGGAVTGGNITVTVEWMEVTTITP